MQEYPDPFYDQDEKLKNDDVTNDKPKRKRRPRKRLQNALFVLTAVLLAAVGAGFLLIPRIFPILPPPGSAVLLSEMVHAVAWSPDGQSLAVASDSGLRVYPADMSDSSGTFLTVLDYETHELIYSPDGRWLAHADIQQVRVWDMQTGLLHRIFPASFNIANTIAFSSDSQSLAIATSADAGVQVWDVMSNSVVSMREAAAAQDQDFFQAVQFTPDDLRLIALGNTSFRSQNENSSSHVMYAWAMQANSTPQLWPLEGFDHSQGWAFSPDSRLLAYVTFDQLRIYDYERHTEVAAPWFKPVNYNFSRALAFAPDNRRLAFSLWTNGSTQNGRGLLRILDVLTNEVVDMQAEHAGHISSARFSPDSRLLATGSWDGTVRLWDTHSGALLTILQI